MKTYKFLKKEKIFMLKNEKLVKMLMKIIYNNIERI